MAKVAKGVALVAGVVALAASAAVTGGATLAIAGASLSTIASAASAIATVASLASTALQKKPPAQGSISQVVIGNNSPQIYSVGRTYVGGMQVFDDSAGGDNRRRWHINIVSAAGPIDSFEKLLADYETINFTATADGDMATGWYSGFMWREWKKGLRPETAFYDDLPSIPGWTANHKLSGYAAYKVKMKFDKDAKRYASGIPALGVVGKMVLAYDPRLDSTYPGGSGPHRWDDELTWSWTDNPSLHALTYARGRYIEKNAAGVPLAVPVRLLGMGLRDRPQAIRMGEFVEFANLCEANGWTVGGSVYEGPSLSKWDNMKRFCEAGAAQPTWAGGTIGVRMSAPRPSLFTLTRADVMGAIDIQAMKSWRARKNSVVPKYRSEAHKWEYVQAEAVTAGTYLAEDGELKSEEYQFDLVQDEDQATQLAAYRMANGREFDFSIVCGPRMVAFRIGEAGTVDIPEEGLAAQKAVIVGRLVDPATGEITLYFESETNAKHAYALGQTGVAPPTPTISSSEALDTAAAEESASQVALLIANSGPRVLALSINTAAEVTVSGHERVYSDKTVMVTGATITATGAVADDLIAVYYDDLARAGGAVTYQYTVIPDGVGEIAEYYASSDNPGRHFVALLPVPATGTVSGGSGVGPGTGGTGSGVGGGGNQPDTVLE